jgi:hypothetical protein
MAFDASFFFKHVMRLATAAMTDFLVRGNAPMSNTTDRILSDFGKCSMALAQKLEEEPQIGLIEQVFIENHIHIIQSAYSSWKRRQLGKASGQ